MNVSFICCVWNEFKRAPHQLKILQELLVNSEYKYEIIIIDNGSTDGTREWISELEDEHLIKILNEKNIGKGGSIRKGIEYARGDVSVIFDLDGEYLASDAITGIYLLQQTKAAVALASRTLDGTKKYIYRQNYLGVIFITWVINKLFGSQLTDTATGLKIIETQFFKQHNLMFSGFNVDFEIVCVALKNKRAVEEYKGFYLPRSKSEGKKIKALQDGLASLFAIITTRVRA